jgi:hypothetical protein
MNILLIHAKVFIGIETPDENCLAECRKVQNGNRAGTGVPLTCPRDCDITVRKYSFCVGEPNTCG